MTERPDQKIIIKPLGGGCTCGGRLIKDDGWHCILCGRHWEEKPTKPGQHKKMFWSD